MNNTSNSQNSSSQINSFYPHSIYSFARKDYTIAELLTVLSADFLDLIYQHNVLPPESTFAAIRVSIPTLNLLKIVVPTFTNYKICYCCNNCPNRGQRLTS